MKLNLDSKRLADAIFTLVKQNQQVPETQLRSDIKRMLEALDDNSNIESTQEVTILLSDIRGFTSISERYSASQILHMLNNYFSRMNDIIVSYGGMIDKYMGDAIMVVFGVPENHPDDAANAVACAIEMQLAMDEVNAYNKQHGFPEIYAGIGLNTDTVSSGKLGSEIHNEFTVIGDGVNLASRIESHSLRGQVLISEYTYAKIADIVETGHVNHVQVKGKKDEVSLYEVKGISWQGKNLQVPSREIRGSMRIEVDSPFSFQILKGKNVEPEIIHGTIQDLGYHGLFAVSEKEIPVLTNLRFKLSLSLVGGTSQDIYAKILSRRKLENGFGYGIEFTDLDPPSAESIRLFVNRIIAGT